MPILASGAACCEAGVENDEDQAVAYPLRHHERPNSYPTIPAWKVFEASKKVTFAAPQMESDEVRWMDIAEVQGVVLVLVYTRRADSVRGISFRRAKRKERRAYNAAFQDR